MKTVNVKLYEFSELSNKAKKHALDKYRYVNIDPYWYQVTVWEAQNELKEKGYEDPEIEFTGFYSQGDGASFTATLDLDKFPLLKGFKGKASVTIVRTSNRHAHEYSVGIEWEREDELTRNEELQLNHACDKVIDEARTEMKAIYHKLRDEYEYRTMDSAVEESLQENEYMFTEHGDMYDEDTSSIVDGM